MNTLFLDLASASSSMLVPGTPLMACTNGDELVALRPLDDRLGDDEIIPALEAVLQEASWKPEDIERIACVTGPGGFTSLRIAVTLANTLADQLKVPLAGIHLSDLYAARRKTDDAIWVHATKRDKVFVRGFGKWEELWSEPTLVELENLAIALPAHAALMGELIESQREVLDPKEWYEAKVDDVSEVLPSLLQSLDYKKEVPLEPWYGREA